MIRFILYKFTQWIVCAFPLSVSLGLAQFLSDCQHNFSSKDRESVRKNIASLEDDPVRVKHLTREVFRNFGRYLVEFLWMKDHLSSSNLNAYVKVNGKEHLDQAYSRNKGVIIVTGHIGNWELGAAAVSLLKYPITAIALEHPHSRVNEFFNMHRTALGVKISSTNEAIKKCSEALKNKEIIAIVAERDFQHNGYRMPFLAKTAEIPKGPAIFSLKNSSPIVPVFLTRRSRLLAFELNIYPPIYPEQFNEILDNSKKTEEIIKSYINIIEGQIRKDPSQWIMFREYDE